MSRIQTTWCALPMNTLLSQWVQSTHASHICAYFHHLGRFVELQPWYILQTKNANIVLCRASAISPISSPKVRWLKFKSSPRGALKREKKAAFMGMSVYTYMHSPSMHAHTHTQTHRHNACTHSRKTSHKSLRLLQQSTTHQPDIIFSNPLCACIS